MNIMKLVGEMGTVMNMQLTMKRFVMSAVACGVVQVVSAQVAITQVVPMSTADQGTELRVMFNGLPVQPKAYQLESPSRLILDFEGATNSVGNNVSVNTTEIGSVEVLEDTERSRLTINLKDHGAFTTRTEGNTFILKVAPEIRENVALPTNVAQATQQQNMGLTNIGFERGAQGEGLVNIELGSAHAPVDVQQQGSKVVVRMLGTKVPAHLARRLNVGDFATPVNTIDAYNEGSNGVIVIQPSGSYEYMAYQAEDKLTISVKRPVDNSTASMIRAPQTYNGKKISLDFQDIEVRRVLQLLADFTNVNMVAADSVQGQITIRLKDVPWDQALDIILKSKNLDKRRNGNVIWIAPVAELIKAEEDEAKAIAQSVKLAPIQTDYIQLNYAKVADVEKLITERKNGSTSGSSNQNTVNNDELAGNLLSPRGSVSSDIRTNTLIVNDTAQKIDEIRKMIELIDVPVKQVMIEARIVRASNDFSKAFGVKWGVLSQGITNNNDLLVGGSDTTLWNLRKPTLDNKTGQYTYEIERPQNLNVDLGVANPAGRIAFGLISLSDFMLDLELSASEADGLTEIVSTPKVLTADKQKASIKSGTQIPYQSSSGAGANAVPKIEFIDATLTLDVTPSITPDGKVSMQLSIAKDAPGAPAPNGELTIDKNQIETNVLVSNGETVVLGGVFETVNGNNVTKVPFFGDLPIVGNLFKTTSKVDNRDELLIFVTPRIVTDNSTVNR
uniref:type IV pilus secretin PilQ n=1 Tax=uncultured Acinetobacter sp. TaxID=165433 RepID=UPI00260DB9FF|nr:type IV pilus secretin PilQ [uncultured Acinetobacter sp.]